jgi:DNA polymerase-3 subunit epsilon
MSPWHLGTLCSLDTETSGLDPEQIRIVTAAILNIRPQRGSNPADDPTRWTAVDRYGWISDAGGADIPEAASAVHGYTSARARAEGKPAAGVVRDVAIVLTEQIRAGVPIVVMNAPYDLTLLDRELQRHGLVPLAEQAGREPLVIDPRVLDKHVDQWRKGRRTLTDLAAHYEVELTGAHQAAADALAAAQVAVAIAQRHPAIGDASLADLHKAQIVWAAEQAADLERYFARKGRPEHVSRDWPMIPRPAVTA